MKLFRRRTCTWLLTGLFALAWAIGEGWHFVPGNAHLAELPRGFLFVGQRRPCMLSLPADHLPGLQSPREDRLSSADEADCPICRLVAKGQWFHSAAVEPAPELIGQAELDGLYNWRAISSPPFHARAPPPA
ncbi:MAG: hypothetical protein KKE86_14400 [Planctomycetes bacterium]|nr:hypothetical protein [Planctomycetota bacterium]MBU4400510.1 hypothetical protein [Planctomycetota bacterium]MCG2684845.1 hypothetical protein [Planctomycetales bacterium]